MSITPAVPVESPAPAGIESRSKWAVAQWHLAAGAVLFLLIVAGYGNSFRSEWVLDNRYIIEQDPRTKAIQWDDAGNTPGVRSVFTQDYWWPKGISGLYRPITSFTYWLNWTAFGNGHHDNARQQVVGFHWVNLGIHSLNAILFYALMLRLTKRYWVSFFAAAIFALHPVATESVTNIIGRADMLAGTTVIGGMLLCFAIAQSSGWKKVGYLISLMLLAALGFFSKESSGALVFVVILYDVVYRLSDRIHEIDWREVCLAISRAVTIAGLMFFTVCVYLLVLVPWMGEMRDVSNVLPTSPSVINPPAGHVGFDSTSALDARAISITDPLANHKSLHDELERRIDANSNFSGRIKIGKASDGSQWALFDAQGKIVKGGTSSLSLHYVGGHGLPSLSEPVDVCLVDSRFPLAITGTIIGLCLMFATTALLALRRFSIVVVTTVVASSMLIAMSASYTPMSDTQPPGAGQVLIRKNLVPNPTTPQMRDAARDAQEQHRPNPVLLAFRNVSTWGLAIFAVAFLVSEASFRFLWAERKEDDPARSKWVGFFDVYYVLLSVTVLLFVVRDWIFANATPAEQPFLDNPLHNLSFIASRLTAAKVFVLLLWKLIWPIHLSPEYSYNQIPLFGFHGVTFWQNLSCIIALFVIVAIAGMAIWCWRRGHKAVCFFIFLYYINAFPTSNFPYIIGSIMAERFLYLPLIGFAAVVVIGIDATSKRIWGSLDESMPIVRGAASPNFSAFRVVPHIILAILVVLYGLRAYAQQRLV